MTDIHLTPDQARARFGELLDPGTRTPQSFADLSGGTWQPEMERKVFGLI